MAVGSIRRAEGLQRKRSLCVSVAARQKIILAR